MPRMPPAVVTRSPALMLPSICLPLLLPLLLRTNHHKVENRDQKQGQKHCDAASARAGGRCRQRMPNSLPHSSFSRPAAHHCRRSGTGILGSRRSPEEKFVSGNVPGLRFGPAQVLEEGSGRHAQATEPQPHARLKTWYPATVCFLFDTVSFLPAGNPYCFRRAHSRRNPKEGLGR